MAPKQKGGGVEAASALLRAAQLLGRTRFPVIGGLLTDIDGAAAALALAKKLFASAHLVFKGGEVVKTVVGSLPKQRLTGELEPWLGSAVASSAWSSASVTRAGAM